MEEHLPTHTEPGRHVPQTSLSLEILVIGYTALIFYLFSCRATAKKKKKKTEQASAPKLKKFMNVMESTQRRSRHTGRTEDKTSHVACPKQLSSACSICPVQGLHETHKLKMRCCGCHALTSLRSLQLARENVVSRRTCNGSSVPSVRRDTVFPKHGLFATISRLGYDGSFSPASSAVAVHTTDFINL